MARYRRTRLRGYVWSRHGETSDRRQALRLMDTDRFPCGWAAQRRPVLRVRRQPLCRARAEADAAAFLRVRRAEPRHAHEEIHRGALHLLVRAYYKLPGGS